MRRDEHGARARLIATPSARPLRHVVVAVGDRAVRSRWILARRCHAAHDDRRPRARRHPRDRRRARCRLSRSPPPRVCRDRGSLSRAPQRRRRARCRRRSSPRADRQVFSYRDREDELEGVARRIKADRRRGHVLPLDRIGLVVRAAAAVSLSRARSVCRRRHSVRSARYAAAGRGTVRGRRRCRPRMRGRQLHAARADGAAAVAALPIRGRRRGDRSRVDRRARRRRWRSSAISAASIACARSPTRGPAPNGRPRAPRLDIASTLSPLLEIAAARSIRSSCCERFSMPTIAIIAIADATSPARPCPGARRLDRGVSAARSGRDRHRHRAVRRAPAMAWHADVRRSPRPAAASASSTRQPRDLPNLDDVQIHGPGRRRVARAASVATCSIPGR